MFVMFAGSIRWNYWSFGGSRGGGGTMFYGWLKCDSNYKTYIHVKEEKLTQ